MRSKFQITKADLPPMPAKNYAGRPKMADREKRRPGNEPKMTF